MYSVLAERDRKIATLMEKFAMLTENFAAVSRDNATLMENFTAVSRDKATLLKDNEEKDKLIAELMRKMNRTELN